MTGDKRVFVDSNVLIYLLDSNKDKKRKVENLLLPSFFISTQVVSENVNICLKKLRQPKDVAFTHARMLLEHFQLLTINHQTLDLSFSISEKYQFSYWDSLIIATALEARCEVLLSEDLQANQIIENQLTIINPFKSKT